MSYVEAMGFISLDAFHKKLFPRTPLDSLSFIKGDRWHQQQMLWKYHIQLRQHYFSLSRKKRLLLNLSTADSMPNPETRAAFLFRTLKLEGLSRHHSLTSQFFHWSLLTKPLDEGEPDPYLEQLEAMLISFYNSQDEPQNVDLSELETAYHFICSTVSLDLPFAINIFEKSPILKDFFKAWQVILSYDQVLVEYLHDISDAKLLKTQYWTVLTQSMREFYNFTCPKCHQNNTPLILSVNKEWHRGQEILFTDQLTCHCFFCQKASSV